MAEHISWGDVIFVVFPSYGIWTWEGEIMGAGLEQGDHREPWVASPPPWLGEDGLPGRTTPSSALSP